MASARVNPFRSKRCRSDFMDEESYRSTAQLIPITFPAYYDDERSKSEILAVVSTMTEARTRLTREQLEADLPTMTPQIWVLAKAVIGGASLRSASEDIYERESGLRYWLVNADGRQLFSEWIKLFIVCPDYLTLVPLDVQEMVEGLHAAPATVQQRAMQISFNSQVYVRPSAEKWLREPEDQEKHPSTKKPNILAGATHALKPKRNYKKVDIVRGRKDARWSRSRLNAWEKIHRVPRSNLPATAFDEFERELDSHCTPAAADIRLCKYPVSMEEYLTYFPDHSYWRELAQRSKRSWTAAQQSRYILWSRGLRNRMILERTTLQHRLDVAKKLQFNTHATTVAGSMENISHESGVEDMEPYDVFICDLAEGLRHHPTGKGAQLLTRVIQHALEHEDPYNRRYKLSEVETYAARHGITVPSGDRMGSSADMEDKAALSRCQNVIKAWFENHTS